MKFLKEVLCVWKNNLLPALLGITPLLVIATFAGALTQNARTNLLILGLSIAAWTFGVTFSRETPERFPAKWTAALLPLLSASVVIGFVCTVIPEQLHDMVTVPGNSMPPGEFRKILHAVYIGACISFALYSWLAGYAGRRIGKATAPSLLAGLFLFLLAAPVLGGVSAAFLLAFPVIQYLYLKPYLAYMFGFLPAIPVFIVWLLILARRGGRNTLLRGARDFGVIAAGSLVIFAVACGVTLIRADGALELAKKSGRSLEFRLPHDAAGAAALAALNRASDAWYDKYSKQTPPVELPFESVHEWTGPESPVTEEMRKAAAAEIGTPEAKAFLAAAAELEKHRCFSTEKYEVNSYLSGLNRLRSLMRQLCGIAAVHHWKGEHGEILPALRLAQEISRVSASGPKLPMGGLIHSALDWMLANNIVELGPDGPQHAGEYRRYLDYFSRADYAIPDELEFLSSYLRKALEWPKELDYPHHNVQIPFLQRIFVISQVSGQVRERAEAQHILPQLRAAVKIEEPENAGEFLRTSLSSLKREKLSHAILPTLMALKLYRSLHGRYPEKLEALVPEILPRLPVDPATGKPFVYAPEGSGFTLTYRRDDREMNIGSSPTY